MPCNHIGRSYNELLHVQIQYVSSGYFSRLFGFDMLFKMDSFMFWFNMLLELTFLRYLEITLITAIMNTFMFCFNMLFKSTFLCCLVFTLITAIVNSYMFWFNMMIKSIFLCGLENTAIICSLMLWFNVVCKFTFLCGLVITLATIIMNSFMTWSLRWLLHFAI